MSTFSPSTQTATNTAQGVGDAVWQFMTSLKVVKKRNGQEEAFDKAKLAKSIGAALTASGLKDDGGLYNRTVDQVIGRLMRIFDGHTTPSTSDIREVINLTFIDLSLAQVSKKYGNARYSKTDTNREARYGHGITVPRYFTTAGKHPYDLINWQMRTAKITNEKGVTVFEQNNVEVPDFWSQTATNIVVQKYFRGKVGRDDRETSVKQLISRVAVTMADWGRKDGYFQTAEDAMIFEHELTHILVNQMAAFNSPVWFNVGVNPHPQCSACFINSVQDDMRSILQLCTTEGMIFKNGSGSGINLSPLRSSKEFLGGSNGRSSGPISFMKGLDAFAGVIKSGGKTRRAAKMVILNVEHPDIEDFIKCKVEEEKKAWALMDAGYDGSIDGTAYSSIFFQNANNSVRVPDEFIRTVENDGEWVTKEVVSGKPSISYKARNLMQMIGEAAWHSGDPGMQYDTTINKWHTCKNTDRIHASNPCVTGDTLVSTAHGYRRIEQLVDKKISIVNANGEMSPATRIWKTGHKAVYQLKTQSGYSLKLTGDHKVKTITRGDVPAHELQTSDRLMLAGVGFGRTNLNESLAEAMGLAVGDGCLVFNHLRNQEVFTLTMGRHESEVLQWVGGGLEAYKTVEAQDGRGARTANLLYTPTTVRYATSQHKIVEVMKDYAVLDQGSEQKKFLDAVFTLDQQTQAAILRGLYTADGTVANYGDKSQYISLDSTSLTLLEQTQLLLLGFGIKAKMYQNRRSANQTSALLPDGRGGKKVYPVQQMHSLRISRSSRMVFEKEIGFIEGSQKNTQLQELNRSTQTYADHFDDAFVSLTYLGQEDVYDLTEPVTHHFVANGLVVHNCSEYMFLNDTACNLSSLNLMRFRKQMGDKQEFDVTSFSAAARVVITAMEITVGNSSYPTPAIEQNSHDFRPLGIGYANLGALLMSRSLAYDSDEARNFAAAMTSLLSGVCYDQSALIAEKVGAFNGYKVNAEPCMEVMRMHRDASYKVSDLGVPQDLQIAHRQAWEQMVTHGDQFGVRNSQISVIAPTGTISFLMDCDTTGIEPDIALVKYKWLVGGGMIKIVNQTVPEALARLGYSKEQVEDIMRFVDEKDTVEGAPHLVAEHLPIFDCAFKAKNGTRSIHYMGHIRMMAAVQPFVSGAISKTVNMPNESTVQDVIDAYMEGSRLGLKAIAIYRDGSKRQQPLTTSLDKDQSGKAKKEVTAVAEGAERGRSEDQKPRRHRLPDERRAITHKFAIGSHEGYITVGLYDDGKPGEMFITMAKEGTVVSGLMDAFATSVSIGLQYGVPLQVLVNKFVHMRFEPSGYTNNEHIRIAKSIVDYIFRWMALKFMSAEEQTTVGVNAVIAPSEAPSAQPSVAVDVMAKVEVKQAQANIFAEPAPFSQPLNYSTTQALPISHTSTFDNQSDAPACETCGAIMVRNAACYKCLNCGGTSGCS